MDYNELGMTLHGLKVPDSIYSIGRLADDHYCLVPGKDEGTFEVFWYERGGRHDRCVYTRQDAACWGMLGMIGGGLDGSQPLAPGRGTAGALGGAPISHPAVQALLHDDAGGVFGELTEDAWVERFVVQEDRTLPMGERRLIWPDPKQHPDGFADPTGRAPIRIAPGRILDSFGSTYTRLMYDMGTPFVERSLPIDYAHSGYRRWRVISEMPVWAGPVAPWFGQRGGGTQYFTVMPVVDLVGSKFIEEIAS
ncbi:TNT domain-containing protein [Nocardia cyriacigeorgica]|uniref:TNT domain-containing protein n=1 Tax=Nocardia cyriacigeorgica TaxID=135487 RepID=UPI0024545411|nr:TNT domain-containing protein [Nocardia cyriacigeorgica]